MAQKIKLGARPKSFKRDITFPLLEGESGAIEVSYKYRTRSEFAKLTDELQAAAQAAGEAEIAKARAAVEAGEPVKPLTQIEMHEHTVAFQVDQVMQAVDGWNLDVPFDRKAVEQLADELPAAITAIIVGYRSAITEGRLGN
jgi:hypothetical protein